MSNADYRELIGRAVAEKGARTSAQRQLIEKEILHYDILHAMAEACLLDHLVFHGGTALRLCHGGERLSEDLDFCAGPGFTERKAEALGPAVQHFLQQRYGRKSGVTEPKDRDFDPVRVRRWWVRMETEPSGRSYGASPWQRIKLEIADVLEHQYVQARLGRNYSVIPDSHASTEVRVATREGILADKLIAFPQKLPDYVRWRDIWDVNWLVGQGVRVDAKLVQAKLESYGISDFDDRLTEAGWLVDGLVLSGGMAEALGDFVSPEVAGRTLDHRPWLEVAATRFREVLEELQRELDIYKSNDPTEIPDPFGRHSPYN